MLSGVQAYTYAAWPTRYAPGAGTRRGVLFRRRDVRRRFGGRNLCRSSTEADEGRIEGIEPAAQARGIVAIRIIGHEDDLDPARIRGWHVLERLGDVRHVHRTDVGAMRIAEEQQGDVTIGFLAEIEGLPLGIGEGECRLFLRRRKGQSLDLVGGVGRRGGGIGLGGADERHDNSAGQ